MLGIDPNKIKNIKTRESVSKLNIFDNPKKRDSTREY